MIACVGLKINGSIKEKALRLKYIEIAVGILKEVPSEEREPLRTWAIDILKEFSPIELQPAAIETLKKQRLSESVTLSGISARAEVGKLMMNTTQ